MTDPIPFKKAVLKRLYDLVREINHRIEEAFEGKDSEFRNEEKVYLRFPSDDGNFATIRWSKNESIYAWVNLETGDVHRPLLVSEICAREPSLNVFDSELWDVVTPSGISLRSFYWKA